MMTHLKRLMAICLLLSPLNFIAQDDCQLRTQTPGGWGAPANGNNPGVYRDAYFDDAFPDGLTVGCDYTLTLTSAQAVEDFLPCGGPPKSIDENYVDPDCINNVFSQHLVALTLSVGFDNNDPDFGESDTPLADAVVNNGTFEGWTVAEILVMANEVFGGCSDEYSPSQAKSVVAMINENFVDGDTNNGNLDCEGCPDNIPPYVVWGPEDLEIDCSDEIPFEEPIFGDDSDDDLDVSFEESTNGDGCNLEILRYWEATDDCGNSIGYTQMIYAEDNTPPVLMGVPGDDTIPCDGEVPDAIVSADDNCDDDITVTLTAETIPLECGEQLIRTWYAEDDCGNWVEETQILNFYDDVPPVLSEYPEDLELDCGAETPPAPEITATDNCDPDVTVEFNEEVAEGGGSGDCFLTTPDMPAPEWSLVLFGLPNEEIYYTTLNADLEMWMDGDTYSAVISGSVINSANPNSGFDFVLTLYDGMDWETWSSQPWEPSYKDDFGLAGDNYLDWMYFLIDGENSYLEGWGDYEGSYLTLVHAPASLYYGYQFGIAANNVNTNDGNGGWFTYSGTFVDSANGINEEVSAIGDFAFDQQCCESQTITRTWTSTDCSGNVETHVQTITFGNVEEEGANIPDVGTTCEGDFDGDGFVGAGDLLDVLMSLGCNGPDCAVDLNDDQKTDSTDILIFLSKFGDYCE